MYIRRVGRHREREKETDRQTDRGRFRHTRIYLEGRTVKNVILFRAVGTPLELIKHKLWPLLYTDPLYKLMVGLDRERERGEREIDRERERWGLRGRGGRKSEGDSSN